MANNESLKKNLMTKNQGEIKKKKPETIQQWVKAYEGQIAKALPSVLTPERFSRMVLTALSKTPKLAECSPQSFVGAMLTAAQMGLEPNTPLGQAYLIPYKDECQFQLGYKGMLDLAYRSGNFKCIMAEIVYENDEFSFSYGLDADLKHKPAMSNRGDAKWVYAMYKLENGGYSFKVMSIDDIRIFAKKYSKTFNNGPWQTDFESMAKKTVIKQLLKYAPLKTEFAHGVASDGTVNNIEFNSDDTAPVVTSVVIEAEEYSVAENKVDTETGEVLSGDDLSGTPFED